MAAYMRSLVLARTCKFCYFQPVRYRYKPPNKNEIIYPSYADRLKEWQSRYTPPASKGVNIGFHFNKNKSSSNKMQKVKKWSENKALLEAAARQRQLKIDMETLREEWQEEEMPAHVCNVAEHYGIFIDMFDGAHFYPVVPLDITFDYSEELVTPVCYGNIIPAEETSQKPSVTYEAKEDSLWTLIMSSPDGNLANNNIEFLHWAITNIPGNALEKGETVCEYLQPFPARGVGFLRYVFILYKQDNSLDLSFLKPSNSTSLSERNFNTREFYRQHQNKLTPAGIAFFQSEWDKSITSVFHNVLDMKEPSFEFIHPPEYLPEQKEFPHREPFNLYLDLYRDVKDIQEEVIKLKLKDVDPTKPPSPRPKYPNADLIARETPSWVKEKIYQQRLGQGQWKDLYDDSRES